MSAAGHPPTVYYTATSLDGFIATADDSLEWLFEQEGPQPGADDDTGPFSFAALTAGTGAVVMGRTTWDWVQDHDDAGWADPRPTFVLTHRDAAAASGDVRFRSGDVATVHAEALAAAGGLGVWVVGGGDLAADLARAGLLDEVVVSIAAVTLGAGRPLLGGAVDLRLREVERRGAFVCARYDVVGVRPDATS